VTYPIHGQKGTIRYAKRYGQPCDIFIRYAIRYAKRYAKDTPHPAQGNQKTDNHHTPAVKKVMAFCRNKYPKKYYAKCHNPK
jgi:hypothetical protein